MTSVGAPHSTTRVLIPFFLKTANLVAVESDEQPAVTGPILRSWPSLIQDQLKAEQADFKHECPTLLHVLPLQREA